MAVGSVTGALLSAQRENPRLELLLQSAAVFGAGMSVAALMPDFWLFGLTLVAVGAAVQTFNTTANSTVQLSTAPEMRGRVVAILLAVAVGTTPLGAPLVGWVADTLGARWALGIGAAGGFAALLVGLTYLGRHRHLRLRFSGGQLRLLMDA